MDRNNNYAKPSVDNFRRFWWRVDLEAMFVIERIYLYVQPHAPTYESLHIYVQRHTYDYSQRMVVLNEHYIVTHYSETTGIMIHATHTKRFAGRYIQLRRKRSFRLPEIEVYGYLFHNCTSYSFGVGCLKSCNCRTKCDTITGACSGGCVDGFQGTDCQTRCHSGTFGNGCNSTCNCAHATDICDHITGQCMIGCMYGFYGEQCSRELSLAAMKPILTMDSDSLVVTINGYHLNTRAMSNISEITHIDGFIVQHRPKIYTKRSWMNQTFLTLHDNAPNIFTLDDYMLMFNTVYEVRVLPLKFIDDEQIIGIPSKSSFVQTSCSELINGIGCENWCQCLNDPEKMCFRYDKWCHRQCREIAIGNTCNLELPKLVGNAAWIADDVSLHIDVPSASLWDIPIHALIIAYAGLSDTLTVNVPDALNHTHSTVVVPLDHIHSTLIHSESAIVVQISPLVDIESAQYPCPATEFTLRYTSIFTLNSSHANISAQISPNATVDETDSACNSSVAIAMTCLFGILCLVLVAVLFVRRWSQCRYPRILNKYMSYNHNIQVWYI